MNEHDWASIVPFGVHKLPEFPMDALPTWLQAFVEAETEHAETPGDLPGVLALAAIATAVAGKAQISPKPGWFEPLNLFCLVAMPPASRKSAVFSAIVAPLLEYERAENANLAPEIAAAESEKRILRGQIEEIERKAAHAKTQDERNEFISKAQALACTLAALKVPNLLRLFSDDTTLERLAGLMAEHQGRMALLSAEGGIFGTLAGRYNEKGANLDVFLKGHAGDALRVDRVGRPAEYIDKPCLTLGLAVQPEVLRGLTHTPGFRGRGLLARFLFSLPASNVGSRPNKNPPVPVAIADAYKEGLHRLLLLPVETNEDGSPRPLTLKLEPKAVSEFDKFRDCIEAALRPEGDLHEMEDWGGKLAGAVARLAGVLHMAEHGDTECIISHTTLCAAMNLSLYFTAHAHAAFDLMGMDAEIEDARHVLAWMVRTSAKQFTQRTAHNALQGRFKRVDPLERALRILAERHYVRSLEAETHGGAGRKPSPTFEVNPALHNIQNVQN